MSKEYDVPADIPAADLAPTKLAKYIDHTVLRPGATDEERKKACDEAREYGFYSVCVYWNQIEDVSRWLEGSETLPIAVVGFPGGEVPTSQKVEETLHAVRMGAREIDMVLNRDLLRAAKDSEVIRDIQDVVEAAKPYPVKVILETSELGEEEKRRACHLSKQAGAAFVKTSTGFSKSGATEADVRLMRQEVGPHIGVKASGGIRSYQTAIQMIEAGASRLGTSASVDIVRGAAAKGSGY